MRCGYLLDLLGKTMRDTQDIHLRISRIHVDDPRASLSLAAALRPLISQYRQGSLVFVCIGTDRSTGDCLGPLIGTRLDERVSKRYHVYGTLDKPVHATNLKEVISAVQHEFPEAHTLAIDACLGRSDSVGYINVCNGPLHPGTGVNKSLPSVGHCHITGVVNVGGFMEYMVLQNTRLNIVMRMSEIIYRGIAMSLREPADQTAQGCST